MAEEVAEEKLGKRYEDSGRTVYLYVCVQIPPPLQSIAWLYATLPRSQLKTAEMVESAVF